MSAVRTTQKPATQLIEESIWHLLPGSLELTVSMITTNIRGKEPWLCDHFHYRCPESLQREGDWRSVNKDNCKQFKVVVEVESSTWSLTLIMKMKLHRHLDLDSGSKPLIDVWRPVFRIWGYAETKLQDDDLGICECSSRKQQNIRMMLTFSCLPGDQKLSVGWPALGLKFLNAFTPLLLHTDMTCFNPLTGYVQASSWTLYKLYQADFSSLSPYLVRGTCKLHRSMSSASFADFSTSQVSPLETLQIALWLESLA